MMYSFCFMRRYIFFFQVIFCDPVIRNKLGLPKRIPLTAALASLRIRIIHRKRTIAFFQFIMGMQMLRHEEHDEKEDLLVGTQDGGARP
ncbi:unnamed protein product [Acanthoscelides obtectus]|uniref:Uncharacterized protein n=1 Tax=Acanthoscelides obtectus TaxID=200917 RepID=A0A9P0L3L3_ACAOB|nr:unnamed protein product [Acanthoscelides obtectus]CAK1624630.1 hypothetical protein AOBTE_LOCUS2662 [Acanthoscelides obtectus]